MKDVEPLIPKFGGYRKLKSFRMAQLVRDVTEQFCNTFVDEESRNYSRMMQEACNGAEKIAGGSIAGEESKKQELALTRQARTSLETLRLLYVDFLSQQELPVWDAADTRRAGLVARRPRNLDDFAQWVHQVQEESATPSTASISSITSIGTPETPANGAIALIALAVAILDRQLSAEKRVVDHEANLADRLRRRRLADWPG